MKSMKVTLLFAVLFIGLAFTMQAQVKNDDILMTIAGKKITVGRAEWKRIHMVNYKHILKGGKSNGWIKWD